MKIESKILHSVEKVSRDGRTYFKVLVLTKIGSEEFIQTYYIWNP